MLSPLNDFVHLHGFSCRSKANDFNIYVQVLEDSPLIFLRGELQRWKAVFTEKATWNHN